MTDVKRSYAPLTVAEHVALGNALKVAWDAVISVPCRFPKTSRATQAALKVEKALLALKSVLDNDICHHVPTEHDPRRLATKVYYGPPLIAQPDVPPELEDAFAGWERVVRRQGDV